MAASATAPFGKALRGVLARKVLQPEGGVVAKAKGKGKEQPVLLAIPGARCRQEY